ncbi:hypothetical protein WA026_009727 [Henosepilachna vigintioctopunctata]|uniref:N-acetyltransferase domain-containing protein n=1 Tax=Henosepilachna vigintioctopunctata TaxID=420089 RepID=A0AAW1TSN5_9CUCU
MKNVTNIRLVFTPNSRMIYGNWFENCRMKMNEISNWMKEQTPNELSRKLQTINLIRPILIESKNYSKPSKEVADPKKCPKKIPYIMCQPMVEEFETVLDIVNRIYFRKEPSLKFLGIKMNPFLERQFIDKLKEGVSIMAKCKYTGRIVGIALNETIKPWEHEIIAKQAKSQKCAKTKEMMMFWAYLTKTSNPFQGDPCLYEIFKSTVLYMDRAEQRFGLGRMIAKECINMAIREKYKLIKSRTTDARYAETLRLLGFNQILHLPFDAYKNEDGIKVLEHVPPPNIGAKVFSMNLTNKKELEVY